MKFFQKKNGELVLFKQLSEKINHISDYLVILQDTPIREYQEVVIECESKNLYHILENIDSYL
jgi:hypothetical protein